MRRLITFAVLVFLVVFQASAQTGPAGIGTSTNNVFWIKGDAGVSTSTAGTPVSGWNDQSGNAINVAQTNINQQPVYRNNFLNGFPVVEFDNANTTGQNDYLIAPDNALLDNTSGYTIFTVSQMKNLGGNARCIVSKRTSVDTDEAFMFFYYSSDYMYLDIDGTSQRLSTSPVSYTTNTPYIFDAWYDGTLPAANRCRIYEGETLRKTATENSAVVADKNSPLLVGTTHTADNRAFAGYIGEVIIYRTALNDASRIIINNYLSAKYNILLAANDKYVGDISSNGDYDREVSGVGMETSGSNGSFASSISGGIGISTNSGLEAGDYVLSGHAFPSNSEISYDVDGMSGTDNARWQRIWYIDVTNAGTTLNTNIEFDASDAGISSPSSATLGDYVLLYRSAQTGAWTELTTASALSGDKVQFNNIDLTADGYYTLGLNNINVVPLPVSLISFNASMSGSNVLVKWSTASEQGNDFFTLQRSKDGINFETIGTQKGNASSSVSKQYSMTDVSPYNGTSYYRLLQTDHDGSQTTFPAVSVNNSVSLEITIFPNPVSSDDPVFYISLPEQDQEVLVVVRDVQGREFYSRVIVDISAQELIPVGTEEPLAAGMYMVVASSNNHIFSRKFIVR